MTRGCAWPTRAVGVALSLLLLAAAATASWAHDGPHPPAAGTPPVADATADADGAWVAPLLVALVAAGALGIGRRRRLALGLAVLLVILGFEANVHAMHHLDNPTQAAGCAVAVATAHVLTDTVVDGVATELTAIRPLYVVRSARPAPAGPRSPAPHAGRAPPVPIS